MRNYSVSASDEIDNSTRAACFILFIVEMSLLSLSMVPMILFNFLIIDRRVFHVNVICLLGNVLFLYYVQWAVRIALLILTFTRTIDGKYRVLSLLRVVKHKCNSDHRMLLCDKTIRQRQ